MIGALIVLGFFGVLGTGVVLLVFHRQRVGPDEALIVDHGKDIRAITGPATTLLLPGISPMQRVSLPPGHSAWAARCPDRQGVEVEVLLTALMTNATTGNAPDSDDLVSNIDEVVDRALRRHIGGTLTLEGLAVFVNATVVGLHLADLQVHRLDTIGLHPAGAGPDRAAATGSGAPTAAPIVNR